MKWISDLQTQPADVLCYCSRTSEMRKSKINKQSQQTCPKGTVGNHTRIEGGGKVTGPSRGGGGGVLHIECPIGSWIGAGVEGGNTTYLSVWLILGFDTSPSTQK